MRTRLGSQHLFTVIAALALMNACGTLGSRPAVAPLATIDSLVTAEWLSQHLDDSDLVVLDCTVRVEPKQEGGYRIFSGRGDYEKGHIPTASFADLTGDLSASDTPLHFAVPPPEQFAAAMGALGVGNDSRVVLYSGNNPAWAARVWWMLRWIGFDRAAVLDGGLKAWTAGGRPLSTEPVSARAGTLTISLRPGLIAGRDEVRAAIGNDVVTIVDANPEPVFRGAMSAYARPGHITGAMNIPASSLTDAKGLYLPREELAALHSGERGGRVITYCGGGISASASAFVMTRLGFTDVAVYTASLQEWAADPANPMEVDTPE